LLKPILILCLGNEIASDDGFGPFIASSLLEQGEIDDCVEVVSAALAGFSLIDLLANRKKTLIVDTIITGRCPPGTVNLFAAGMLTPSKNLITSHQISLPTALTLGKMLGAEMPPLVDIVTVEAEDIETLSETMTPAVQQAVGKALNLINDWILLNRIEATNYGAGEESRPRTFRRAESLPGM